MQPLKVLKKYFIDSQFFVSLCGTLLAAFFMLQAGKLNFSVLILIFFTFWNGYLYTKFQYSKLINKILVFNILMTIICFIIIKRHPEISIIKWLSIVCLGLLYNSFFLEKFVRKIPLVKVFYVGLTWALVCSWLVLPKFSWDKFLISWLFATALVLPFDIRDLYEDDVVTFPKVIGVQNTKYFAYALIFISLLVTVFTLNQQFSLAFFCSCGVAFVLIYFSETRNRDAYFSFWVELCSALPLIFYLIFCRL